jgi:hypothetical protein
MSSFTDLFLWQFRFRSLFRKQGKIHPTHSWGTGYQAPAHENGFLVNKNHLLSHCCARVVDHFSHIRNHLGPKLIADVNLISQKQSVTSVQNRWWEIDVSEVEAMLSDNDSMFHNSALGSNLYRPPTATSVAPYCSS